MSGVRIHVVGIGADGWDGLTAEAHEALLGADVVFGSPRQLETVTSRVAADCRVWPSPMLGALPELVTSATGRVCVLASGDPMWHGVGSTLTRLLGPVRVISHPSAVALACARLGWGVEEVEVVTAVGRPLDTLHPALQPGRRVLVLGTGADAAERVAALLTARGFGDSELTVLTRLGAPDEDRSTAPAHAWVGPHDPLAVIAIDCAERAPARPRTPGLPDDAYDSDGQLTKREIRALTLALLVPVPGQLLWDVGAGSGSVAIEWMRVHPASRAIAIEARDDRRARIAVNAAALGVPGLRIVAGRAPAALEELPDPDAIFVGGGVSTSGVLETAYRRLRPGGRLVANGVTVQTETTLAGWHAELGGTLTRILIQRAEPVGGFTGWRPAMPITQWSVSKP